MESRSILLTWEQTGWPAEDFTVRANREDLERLQQRHLDRQAFTYTVLDPTETVCLGCVYLLPPDSPAFAKARVQAMGDSAWSAHRAVVSFWVRASRLPTGLDRRLLDALRTWLREAWTLEHVLFLTSEAFEQQVALLEADGLRLRFRLWTDGKPAAELAFG